MQETRTVTSCADCQMLNELWTTPGPTRLGLSRLPMRPPKNQRVSLLIGRSRENPLCLDALLGPTLPTTCKRAAWSSSRTRGGSAVHSCGPNSRRTSTCIPMVFRIYLKSGTAAMSSMAAANRKRPLLTFLLRKTATGGSSTAPSPSTCTIA